MSISEDLRGRHFAWHQTDGMVALVEDPIVVGQISRVIDLRPTYFAEFAGERLLIEHSVGVLSPMFEVRDTATQAVVAKHHYTRDGEMRALCADRAYSLRRTSGIAIWNGVEDAVSLRQREAFVFMAPILAMPLRCCSSASSWRSKIASTPETRSRSAAKKRPTFFRTPALIAPMLEA